MPAEVEGPSRFKGWREVKVAGAGAGAGAALRNLTDFRESGVWERVA